MGDAAPKEEIGRIIHGGNMVSNGEPFRSMACRAKRESLFLAAFAPLRDTASGPVHLLLAPRRQERKGQTHMEMRQ
jgi:hypothetical protein